MRRDQAWFLVGGVAFGLVLGLVFGVVVGRPELVGVAPQASPVATRAGQASAVPGSDEPHTDAGMDSVSSRLTELRRRLDQNPDDGEALVLLGELLSEANMQDRAVAHFQRAVSATADPRLLMRAAAGLLQVGSPREALSAARKAMKLDPKAPEPAELAATAALGVGDLDAAEQELAEIERRAPGRASLAGLRNEMARIRRITDESRGKPGDYAAQVAAGNLFFDHGRWAEADAAYRRALKVSDADPNVVTDFGIVLFRQGKNDEALAQFEQAIAKNPAHWQAALNGTVVSLAARDAGRARVWLGRLKTLNPQNPRIPQFEQSLAEIGQ